MNSITKESLSCVYFPLRLAFGLVPLLAGLDKFVGLLTDWGKYLPSYAADVLPISPATFMMVVGVIEIIAGLAVLTVLPRLGAYVVMIWLILIALTLLASGYYDVAVRDLVMAVAAYALGRVSGLRGDAWFPTRGESKHASAHVPA
jgi:uncharacterized membrane protein YphA (DoxX/SURF4 family)